MQGGVTAKFGFLPRASQQLVVLFGFITLIGAVATICFAYLGKPITVPATITGTAAVLAVAGWLLSRGSADLEGSTPVTFSDARTGRSVAADPRLLLSPKNLRLLGEAVNTMLERRPLPMPDGMVQADGTPDVSRVAEAEAVVNGINQQTQQRICRVVESLAGTGGGPATAQPALVLPPHGVVPGANVVSSEQ